MTLTWISNLAYPETFSCGPKTTQVRNQSGGYLAANSFVFGLPTPPPAGTIFAPYCSGSDLRGGIANGAGTNIDSLIAANAPSCGYVLPAGWILSTFCTGTDLWGNVTDGAGGTTPMLLSADAPSCGWVPGTIPVGTYLNPTCVGTDLWADVVTSPGVTVNQVVANNSPQCGYTPPLYEFAWAPTQTSTTSLDVQLDPARGPYTILATPYFRPLTSGQPPTSHSIAGTLLTLNYANPLTPNEPILYVYPNTALFAADGGGPSQLTQLLQ